ncbi:MAG TPA: glutamate racemase [Thermoclostridium sp.]|nr:glutamate racemase [Thermoclostridium sp.]HPU45210.1 glutamate racemase [Thermoclostridium sp.]
MKRVRMNIGFFDSGIGGLTVLREALALLPNENYLYYADTDNTPYGTKTKEEVKGLAFRAVEFLMSHSMKALVIACNAATSASVEDLRRKYDIPIIGMEPAVKPAVAKSLNGGKRVLVLSTALTLREVKFQDLVARVDTEHIVDMLPAPKLVELAERFVFDGPEVEDYLRELLPWDRINCYGTIVLGCTHFPFFRQVLSRMLPDSIDIIDGNRGTVNHLYDVLKSKNLLNTASEKGRILFFRSGAPIEDPAVLEKYNRLLRP